MSKLSHFKKIVIGAGVALATGAFTITALATHSWGGYHWARTENPFNLKLGDNISNTWDPYLVTASSEWSTSNVLDTSIVTGQTRPKNCRPTNGRVEVCNAKYGNNGWLGIAQVWVSGEQHISQAIVKLNDTYFNTPTYNTPAWRRLVLCQEVAHTFGLDHQDEAFDNPNLGSCMDYTSDPGGTLANPDQLSNEQPNTHDYEELELTYVHLDGTTTVGAAAPENNSADEQEASNWGQIVRHSANGRSVLYERNLGNGHKVFTFVTWANVP